ncbi:Heterokaryon incompatibility protein [Pleurostoma richardsiae]|uniref:Heterokaryon incompatibility protein n=1 Tax=Pleurostoma richardsiae TaxID=41990 RepID=A0AA38RJ72_9PEZI|nr:Heterokaryon incompatibility protein [Pleurostoma richardsiae]
MFDFRHRIALTDLPATFRDAVGITRRLGVRYLWIDSLCILQDKDDLSDWLVEASLMNKVYSHSYCNISASAALDSSKGLYSTRDPRASVRSPVEICVRGVHPERDIVTCSIVDMNFWVDNVSRCHINKRGWVLQERLLAPRVLHFGKRQTYWECREHDAAEVYPDGLPELYRLLVYTNFKSFDPEVYSRKMRGQLRQGYDTGHAHYRRWAAIVQSYSETLITKPADKLIALSGVAKLFEELTGDTYVAGMWRRHLASELLWHVDDEQQVDGRPSARPAEYRAPSWSWASVDGRTTAGTTTESGLLIEVVDVHLDHATSDTTGLLTGGYLDLRCGLLPFKMVVHYIGTLQLLFIEVNGKRVKSSSSPEWGIGPLVHLDVGQDNFDAENEAHSLFCVPAQGSTPGDGYSSFLLLEVVDRQQGTFRRIGLAITREEDEIEMLLPVASEDRANVPSRGFTNGLHVIRIL